jgi:2-(1,2-epoxy-1,2-dihydrophenyl)acetyl-CoA isomerase
MYHTRRILNVQMILSICAGDLMREPEVTIRVEREGGCTTITLSRPAQYNAVTTHMSAALLDVLSEVEHDMECRIVLLKAAGKHFCVGQDLGELRLNDAIDLGAIIEQNYNPIVLAISKLRVPVVCAVQGTAAGAGMGLALCCDIVVASRTARFLPAFSRIGLCPDTGLSFHLSHLLDRAQASGILLLDHGVSAVDAQRMGMIWQCVDDKELDEACSDIVNSICSKSAIAVEATKRLLKEGETPILEKLLLLERDLQRKCGNTPHFVSAVTDFLGRRKDKLG